MDADRAGRQFIPTSGGLMNREAQAKVVRAYPSQISGSKKVTCYVQEGAGNIWMEARESLIFGRHVLAWTSQMGWAGCRGGVSEMET